MFRLKLVIDSFYLMTSEYLHTYVSTYILKLEPPCDYIWNIIVCNYRLLFF